MIKVLIVDNDEQIHIELPKLFSGALVSFKHSFTFQDAVMKLAQQEFSLLITDCLIGEFSGLELIKISSEYRPDTKVLIVSDEKESSLIEDELQTINILSKLSKPIDARQIYKLFSDEFNIEPSEFLPSHARDALYEDSDSDNLKSSSSENLTSENDSENLEIKPSSDEDVSQSQDDPDSQINDAKQDSTLDDESIDFQSKTTIEDVPKTTNELPINDVIEDIVEEDSSRQAKKSSDDSTDPPEELNDVLVDQVEDYLDLDNENTDFGLQSQPDSASSETSEKSLTNFDSLFSENDEFSDDTEDLGLEDQQIIDNDEFTDKANSRTSFTDSFGPEEDDLTEQLLYLDSLVSEIEFVDEEIGDSEVTDRISDEVNIETVKERKERLELLNSENVDEDTEDESVSENENQDTSVKYPEKKRPDDSYLTIIVSQDQLEAYLILYPHEEDFHSLEI